MKFSIIIVNYNTTDFLKNCLDSILSKPFHSEFEILAVDNNSDDGKFSKLKDEYLNIKMFERKVNDGFGAGCNFGASKAIGKYLIFLNPDTVVCIDDFIKMADVLECNHDIGVISPVFTDFNGIPVYSYNKFPNFEWEFNEFLGKGNDKVEKRLMSDKRILEKSAEPMRVDWVSGACLMIRTDLFRKLNGFDENYFLYYEDTDLQYRAKKEGSSSALLPNITVKHFVNSSVKSDEGENVYYYHLNRSKMIFFYKIGRAHV